MQSCALTSDFFQCTRPVKALLPYLPFLIIRPGGFAIEFDYGIRPLIKPMIFKHFTSAFDVFDTLANPIAVHGQIILLGKIIYILIYFHFLAIHILLVPVNWSLAIFLSINLIFFSLFSKIAPMPQTLFYAIFLFETFFLTS